MKLIKARVQLLPHFGEVRCEGPGAAVWEGSVKLQMQESANELRELCMEGAGAG